MPTTTSSSELVLLRGGFAVPVEVLQLLWRLEDRGLTVARTQRGTLSVGPRDRLTEADRYAIKEHRDMLLTLVDYVTQLDAEPPVQPDSLGRGRIRAGNRC